MRDNYVFNTETEILTYVVDDSTITPPAIGASLSDVEDPNRSTEQNDLVLNNIHTYMFEMNVLNFCRYKTFVAFKSVPLENF